MYSLYQMLRVVSNRFVKLRLCISVVHLPKIGQTDLLGPEFIFHFLYKPFEALKGGYWTQLSPIIWETNVQIRLLLILWIARVLESHNSSYSIQLNVYLKWRCRGNNILSCVLATSFKIMIVVKFVDIPINHC